MNTLWEIMGIWVLVFFLSTTAFSVAALVLP